ncbi:MAG: AAA family ATPase [Acetobacterium sp.]|uniref:AAA family ATPase n=1 Tax=Acetobacterium sp. TaxID=1872094 RepID=UPI003242FA23
MNKLFIGKFKTGDQLDKNYYRIDTTNQDFFKQHFNGMEAGDYVLPVKAGEIEKLFMFEQFETNETNIEAKFRVVQVYEPKLALTGNIVSCKYFQPDLNLLNKAIKSTRGVGFIPVMLEENSPEIPEIDFNKSKRRFFVCLKRKLEQVAFFKPFDICLVISDMETTGIEDILEFNGQSFSRKNVLWDLYLDKTSNGNEKYSLRQLLEFANEKNDDAPKKLNYITSLLSELDSESIFPVDSPISLYDNVIVGRKRSASGGSTGTVSATVEDDLTDIEETTDYEKYAKLMQFNPNVILYGPPGTGKTYGAMRIIEAFEKQNGSPASFKQVVAEKRAKFITFHQAFSYEEFVEGIRPQIDEDGQMAYPVQPGVLREFADACSMQSKKKNIKDEALNNTAPSNQVWKVSLGRKNENHIYTTLRDKNVIAIGYGPEEDVSDWNDAQLDQGDPTNTLKCLHSRVNIGDIVMVFNSPQTIRLMGVITSDYFYDNSDGFGYRHRRAVKWLANFEANPKDIIAINKNKQLVQGAIYKLRVSVNDALALLEKEENKDDLPKPYYLIIDEINRGNIAKIFGELITLIEKDKRELLTCELPYSRDAFSIPGNLFLIGTMNTSDRSIALLDTALRRRFAFVEINPDASLVERFHPSIGGNVSPGKLLQALNNRITDKIDRDHRIGHSYFMGDDLVTKYDLYNVWYYKLLPLLMEYFYNDVKQVGQIIGDSFFDKQTGEIIQFNLKPDEDGISQFEAALISIYEKGV